MTLPITAVDRRFVPEGFDPGDPTAVEQLFDELKQRTITTVNELQRWLEDESELTSTIEAEVARRYIEMTCHTDSETAQQRFRQIERDVAPRVKVLRDAFDQKLLDSPLIDQLDSERYAVLVRSRRAAREIFRAENTLLQTEESELQTKQQAVMGQLSVEFRGKTHTMQQMGPYLESQDRELRRGAYMASLEARRAVWEPLEDILDELIGLRTRMARNAGFDTYTPYRFRQLQRFDYDPETCREFHAAVEQKVVPVVRALAESRRQKLGVDTLRPWDLEVDPDGLEPLRPFETEPQLVELVRSTLDAVDTRFATEFDLLQENQLLDLMSRQGKAPGGYQYTIEDVRLPFIFANSVGMHRDVQTMLHEGGHALHAILSRDEPLLDYRNPPIEFAETASMSMELMGLEELGRVYNAADARRARVAHLDKVLYLLPWIASVDAFQLWMYDNPEHDRAARKAHWQGIRDRFGGAVDFSGIEDALAYQWASQPHIFTSPMYYIEYGIAQVAALQVWLRYRSDRTAAIDGYRQGLSLGGSRTLPELFEAMGVRFDVSPEMFGTLVAEVESVLG